MNALLKKLVPSLLLFAACSSTALAATTNAIFWLKNNLQGTASTIVGVDFNGALDKQFTQPITCHMNNTGFPKQGGFLDFFCDTQGKNVAFGKMVVLLNTNGQIESVPCSAPMASGLSNVMIWTKVISYNTGVLERTNGSTTCTITLGGSN